MRADESISLRARDGSKHLMDLAAVDEIVHWACADIAQVDPARIIAICRQSLFDGMQAVVVGRTMVMAVTPLVGSGPGYSQVCARLLLDSLWGEVTTALERQTAHGGDFRAAEYPGMFIASMRKGVELGLLPESLLAYDLDRLSQALQPECDKRFAYPELQSLYDVYLLRSRGNRLELPQAFFMRMAMGQALREDDPDAHAMRIYRELSRTADFRSAGVAGVLRSG